MSAYNVLSSSNKENFWGQYGRLGPVRERKGPRSVLSVLTNDTMDPPRVPTILSFVLDHSPSMGDVWPRIQEDVAKKISNANKLPGKTRVSIRVVHKGHKSLGYFENAPAVKGVEKLSHVTPKKGCAIIDAIGAEINHVQTYINECGAGKFQNVHMFIYTDGKDTSSLDYKHARLLLKYMKAAKEKGCKFSFRYDSHSSKKLARKLGIQVMPDITASAPSREENVQHSEDGSSISGGAEVSISASDPGSLSRSESQVSSRNVPGSPNSINSTFGSVSDFTSISSCNSFDEIFANPSNYKQRSPNRPNSSIGAGSENSIIYKPGSPNSCNSTLGAGSENSFVYKAGSPTSCNSTLGAGSETSSGSKPGSPNSGNSTRSRSVSPTNSFDCILRRLTPQHSETGSGQNEDPKNEEPTDNARLISFIDSLYRPL